MVGQQPSVPAFVPIARLRRLTSRYETPFYLYDQTSLLKRVQDLFDAFSWNSGFRQFLPLRRCPYPALLGLLREAGCGALCTNPAQLRLAAQCGFSGASLLYAPLKRHEQADALALRLDATWALDGEYVLPPEPPRRVLLRYNPGGRLRTDKTALVNFNRVRFGMNERELFDMADRFAAQNTEIGLMLSACDNCVDPKYYPAVAKTLFALAVRVQEKIGVRLAVCNLSGGFGVSSRAGYASPVIADAATQVRTAYEQMLVPAGLGQMRLQTTLDRYLLTEAAILVMSVLTRRERELPTYLVDAPFPQALATTCYHPVSALTAQGKRALALCCVTGCQDSLRGGLEESFVLPELRPGDRLMAHFAGMDEIPRDVPAYLLDADGRMQLICRAD